MWQKVRPRHPTLDDERKIVWLGTACAAADVALLIAISQLEASERVSPHLERAVWWSAAALPFAVFAVYMVRMNPGSTALKRWAWFITALATTLSAIGTALAFWHFVSWFGPDAQLWLGIPAGICAFLAGLTMYAEWRVGAEAETPAEHTIEPAEEATPTPDAARSSSEISRDGLPDRQSEVTE